MVSPAITLAKLIEHNPVFFSSEMMKQIGEQKFEIFSYKGNICLVVVENTHTTAYSIDALFRLSFFDFIEQKIIPLEPHMELRQHARPSKKIRAP